MRMIVDNPKVTCKYGVKRSGIKCTNGTVINDVHNGLDIISASGCDNLYAMFNGKVIYAKRDSTGCNTIITAHHNVITGGVLLVQYSHCSEFKKKVGDIVKEGDVVALMGASGNTSGKHLHCTMLNLAANSWYNIKTMRYIDANKYYDWREPYIFNPNEILKLY